MTATHDVATTAPVSTTHGTGSKLSWAVTDSWTMTRRELAHWARQPVQVVVGLVFPVMMLLMFGFLIGGGNHPHVDGGSDGPPPGTTFADFEGATPARGQVQGRHEIGQHVVHGDRLRGRREPAGAEHHRQPVGQRFHQLERQAARPDDHSRAKVGQRRSEIAERLSGLVTAAQVH